MRQRNKSDIVPTAVGMPNKKTVWTRSFRQLCQLCGNGSQGRPLRNLVPRTRSSRTPSGKCDRELRVQRGTRIIELLVVLGFRSSHENVPRNDANFGIGPLKAVPAGFESAGFP